MSKGDIIIVSGLPRSGTSLMMHILSFSKIPLLTDGIRGADSFNSNGYFEYDPVKSIAHDNPWLAEADGKIIKIVAPLILNLPPHLNYRIIYMTRNPEDIARSQKRMIQKDPHALIQTTQAEIDLLRRVSQHILYALQDAPHINLKCVAYEDILSHPRDIMIEIENFINDSIDITSACRIIRHS